MKSKESNRRFYLVAGGAILIVCAACLCIYAVLAPAGPRYIAGERTRTASELAQLLEKAGPDSALGEYAASLRSQALAARRNRIIVLMPVAFVLAGLGAHLIRKMRRPGAQSLCTEASVTEVET